MYVTNQSQFVLHISTIDNNDLMEYNESRWQYFFHQCQNRHRKDALIKSDYFILAKMTCIFLEVRCNRVTITPHFEKTTRHFFSA